MGHLHNAFHAALCAFTPRTVSGVSASAQVIGENEAHATSLPFETVVV